MHGSSFRSRDQGSPDRPSSGRRSSRRLWLGVAVSLAAHLALLPALLSVMSGPPELAPAEPIVIDLTPFPPIPSPRTPAPTLAQPSPDPDPGGAAAAPEPEPEPVVTPPAAKTPEPPKPPATPVRARPPVPAPRSVPTVAATAALNRGPAAQPSGPAAISLGASLGAGDLIGAAVAGSGRGAGSGTGSGAGSGSGSGGDCDMIARLQRALRDDPEVRDGLVRARRDLPPGRTPLLWNGAWLRTPGEAGEGLAGVRQAIAVEVAFAPPACRSQPMRGLVLLTLADGPAAPAVALGTGAWRWSDLTGAGRR